MEKFAGYGFNKSHSAAYALISYQTAWLKAYHPTEFLAATMSSDMDDTDKVQIFCRDAQDNGVEVLPPDVNHSGYRFEPVADKHTEKGKPPRTMRYGLGAVRARGRARSRKSCGRARKAARFRTCSTSAAVSASIRSTGAPSRR